jgi:hypothetical protein
MLQRLPLPPFGKILDAYCKESVHLDRPIYIYVGKSAKEEAIAQKKLGTMCCYLPFLENHKNYHWPITNQKVVLNDSGLNSEIELYKMCLDLVQDFNPRVIFLYSESFKNQLFLPQGASYNG